MKTFHQPGLVSITLPAYNVEHIISASIESVLAQSYSDWELIIVNDGSWDQTAIQAARYSDPRIKLIHQYKSGEATAYIPKSGLPGRRNFAPQTAAVHIK